MSPTRDPLLDTALGLVRAVDSGDPTAGTYLTGTVDVEDLPKLIARLAGLAVAALRAPDLDALVHYVEYLQDLHVQGQADF